MISEPAAPARPEPDRLLEVVRVLGKPVAILLLNSGWMLRRKDSVELLSDSWARMKSSVDVAIPQNLKPIHPARAGHPDHFVVPVLLLPKVPPTLMKFRFRSGTDKLTLPTRRQNGLTSYAALLWAARRVLGWPLPREIREQLLFVAVGPPEYAAPVSWRMRTPSKGSPKLPALEEMPTLNTAEEELERWCAQMEGRTAAAPTADPVAPALEVTQLLGMNVKLADDRRMAFLLRKLAANSVVVADTHRSPTGSQTISLTYDVNLYKAKTYVGSTSVAQQGWSAYEIVFQTPYVGARSYHFEFDAPAGIEAIDSVLRDQPLEDEWDPQSPGPELAPADPPDDDDDEHGRPEYDYVPIRGHRVHLYRAEGDVPDAITAQLFLRVARERFAGPAFLASAAVASVLAACAILTRPLIAHATGAQTLLLVVPGIFTALIARAGDHALTIRMLQGARRTLLSSGVAAFVGAAFLAMIHTGDGAHAAWWHRWVFIALTLFAVWQAAKLWIARALPRQPHGWWQGLVDGSRRRTEARARRSAIRAQRALKLRVTTPDLTFDRARALATAATGAHCLPLVASPERRWLVEQRPSVSIATEADGEPLLMVAARPGDPYLMQEPGMQRRLAATIRWLDAELGALRLEVRWVGKRDLTRHVLRNCWKILAGKVQLINQPPVRPPRDAAEVAAAARRGALRLHRVHQIGATNKAPGDPE